MPNSSVREESLDDKIKRCFGDVAFPKGVGVSIGLRDGRNIPSYVEEWLVSRYSGGSGTIDDDARTRMFTFLRDHLPSKGEKEALKHRLVNGEQVTIFDSFEASVHLASGERRVKVRCIDVDDALIDPAIIDEYPQLVSGNMWGAGRLAYEELSSRRRIRLVAFQPMQVGKIDIGMFKEQRSSFSTSEWRALLIRSMGNSPDYYSPASQDILLQRLIPFVQPRVNLMELAPKGTGKSFVYVNLSRYCWVVSGGIITPASLFYNNATRAAGLLTRFDTVVLDEGQSIRFPDPAEMAGPLKVYLEAGEFTRGNTRATADASFVILANIETRFDKPARRDYIRDLAGIFDESAVLDRFHGIIPGWQVPRFSRQAIAHGMGLKADFIGEVFRELRNDVEFMAYIRDRIEVSGDQRDATAVERIATALLKLYFPDLRVNAQEFEQVCLVPAIAMRQRIREQLSEIDPGSFRDRPMAKFSIRPSGFST